MIFSQIQHGLLPYISTSYLLIHLFTLLTTNLPITHPPTHLPIIYLSTYIFHLCTTYPLTYPPTYMFIYYLIHPPTYLILTIKCNH